MNQPSHSPPPPPLNQPSLITPLPEIPISILISRHLSTKPIKPTQPHTIQDLIEQKSWKTLADVTADQIIQTDLNETQNLLQLWSIRFECLIRQNQPRILSKELTQFFKLMHKSYHLNFTNLYQLIPFSILIIQARLPFLLNQNETSLNKSINLVLELVRYCKLMCLKGMDVGVEEWKSKLEWLNELLVSFLSGNETFSNHQKLTRIDYDLIHDLVLESDQVSKSQVWIENGDVRSLETYLSSMDHHSLLDTFLCVAKGDWNRCEVKCQEALQNDTLLQLDSNSRILFQNSLALSLLYQGKISEALEIMKTLIDSLNENTLLNSLVFNLVTILELRSIHAQEDKLNLLNQLQNQFSIESLNPIVFKLD